MGIFKAIAAALFPNLCIACGEAIPEGEYLCEYCTEMAALVDYTKNCRRCGSLKKNCECSRRVFHFNGCIAPFYNDGVIRDAMYSFKFAHKDYIGKFFAQKMSIMVKSVYSDIKFDGIVYVPMRTSKRLKRGFNQSEVLARHISKILDLPIFYNTLISGKKTKVQHKLKEQERFKNIKGKFIANKKYNLTGKTILLVDDIKTTGATLDECAKQLMLLGADEVYCITGLMTAKNKKKEGK